MKFIKLRHMKYPIDMVLKDRFELLDELIIKDFNIRGWEHWVGIPYNNPNQLELFNDEKR